MGALTNLRSFRPGTFLSDLVVRKRLIAFVRRDAHPRVTGCSSVHEAFFTLEDVREDMKRKGVTEPKEVIKDGAGETLLHVLRQKLLLKIGKDSFADVWRRVIREGLDQSLRPRDMKLSVEGILHGLDEQTEVEHQANCDLVSQLSKRQEN